MELKRVASEDKRPFVKSRCRWENNNKMGLKELRIKGCGLNLAQYRDSGGLL
jgi:hypothetical protein